MVIVNRASILSSQRPHESFGDRGDGCEGNGPKWRSPSHLHEDADLARVLQNVFVLRIRWGALAEEPRQQPQVDWSERTSHHLTTIRALKGDASWSWSVSSTNDDREPSGRCPPGSR